MTSISLPCTHVHNIAPNLVNTKSSPSGERRDLKYQSVQNFTKLAGAQLPHHIQLGSLDMNHNNAPVINARDLTNLASFKDAAKAGNVVPVWQTIDLQVTSSEALRCMAARTTRPSEIFTEVVGTFTILSAPPSVEVVAESVYVTVLKHDGCEELRRDVTSEDLIADAMQVASDWQPAVLEGSPQRKRIPSGAFCGGWVDLVTRRDSVEPWADGKAIYEDPVRDMGLVDDVVVIDHDANTVHMVRWVHMDDFATPALAYHDALVHLHHLSTALARTVGRSNHMPHHLPNSEHPLCIALPIGPV